MEFSLCGRKEQTTLFILGDLSFNEFVQLLIELKTKFLSFPKILQNVIKGQ